MVKSSVVGPGIYSATYSNIPVYEFQFGLDLKEHVMRRRADDWINATHILKAAGFDKPARTRILERDVQKLPQFEKIQGGYGKYQGTWIPLISGADLARRNNVYDKLSPIFEFRPGNDSPPPAPKHTTNKPKAPKKPDVPKFPKQAAAPTPREASYDNMSTQQEDETPDDVTVASQSFMGDADDYNMPQSQQSTGHRKRKRNQEDSMNQRDQQTHTLYADELLDYFMLSQERVGSNMPTQYPEPPPNFNPNWAIDSEGHTALSWACSMGDVEVMKVLLRFGTDIRRSNVRGETPFMRSVFFVNCYDKKTFPAIVKELIETASLVDHCGSTVVHHAVALTHSKHKTHIARYYLEVLLNALPDIYSPDEFQNLIDAQDCDGNTALHIAAQNRAQKCMRSLLGRNASSNIANKHGINVDQIIARNREERYHQASSSPFAPTNVRMDYPLPSSSQPSRPQVSHHSEAAMTVDQKIGPTMMEKLRDLANSFDIELVDAETSEKSSRRILAKNQEELQATRDQIQELLRKEEAQEPWNRAEREDILAKEEAAVISLLEQQQQYKLHALIQYEQSQSAASATMNGNHSTPQTPDQALAEKHEVVMRLLQEMERRKQLVKEYVDAKAKEGTGENTEKYRRLVIDTLKLDSKISEAELEDNLDRFIEVYENDKADHEREVIASEPFNTDGPVARA